MDFEYVLEMNNITKDYYGTRVLNDVSIKIKPGEIHALVGENGAGKSTLMNILFGMGVIHSTGGFKGEVLLEGKPVNITSPMEAMQKGIGMVHQEFMLINGYEIAENIKLNREITSPNVISRLFGKRLQSLNKVRMREESRQTLDSLGIDLDESKKISELSVGHKQFVEIARELDKRDIKLIVLDEPTAVLSETEAKIFLECVKNVQKQGISFIFISHRLNEVINYSDHVTILRDGERVGYYETKDLTAIRISELMVGREIDFSNREFRDIDQMSTAFELRDFTVNMPGESVRNINFKIKNGEILGIGGLAGHGKISIANGIIGMHPSMGTVIYNGEPLKTDNTLNTLKKHIAFVSEDRRGVGLLLDESVEMNTVVAALRVNNDFLIKMPGFTQYDKKRAEEFTDRMIKELDIRCTGHKQHVRSLSGGNQQKVCIAKALAMNPEVLFVSEPTRGIDVGAKKLILDTLVKLNKEQGMTVVVTSSELAELRSICDRIIIVTEGSIAGVLQPDDEDYKFGMLMSGEKLPEKEVG